MNKNLKQYYPTTGAIIFIIIPIISFIVYFIARDYFIINKADILETRLDKFVQVLKVESIEKDTDGDGLLDWQERLYSTDENNKDTDGDGIPDGKEVKMGTDATDPYNEVFEILKEDKSVDSYKNDENLSSTEMVSRDFFMKLMELKETNLSFNENAQKQAVEELIQENKIVLSEKYKIDDLKISKITGIKNFKNNLSNILKDYNFKTFQDERYLYSRFLETKDQKYADQINKQLEEYKKLENSLSKITVSESLAILYLEYINSFSLFIEVIDSFENFKDDPVLVSSMVLLYNKVENRIEDSSRALTYYFNTNIK